VNPCTGAAHQREQHPKTDLFGIFGDSAQSQTFGDLAFVDPAFVRERGFRGMDKNRQARLGCVFKDAAEEGRAAGEGVAQRNAHGAGFLQERHLRQRALLASGRRDRQNLALGSGGSGQDQLHLGIGVDGRIGEGLQGHHGKTTARGGSQARFDGFRLFRARLAEGAADVAKRGQ
jgi:hypothetical protein